MAEAKKEEKKHIPVVTSKSLDFFERYINNPSPTGFEWSGQRLWLDYLKPYVDETFTDHYGTSVAVVNPDDVPTVPAQVHNRLAEVAHPVEVDRFPAISER